MKPLYQAPIIAKPSSIHGYGVFAEADINVNDVIEECHILLVHDHTALINYLFKYEKNGQIRSCLPLGYGAIYNHADEPNAKYDFDEEKTLLIYKAIKPIKAGEEIYISYGKDWFSSRNAKTAQTSMKFRIKRMLKHSAFIFRAAVCMAGVYVAIAAIHALQTT